MRSGAIDDFRLRIRPAGSCLWETAVDGFAPSERRESDVKILRLVLLVALLALVSVPVVCAAGWVPHCTAEIHEHDSADHHAAPHSSCLGTSQLPGQKSAPIERIQPAPAAAGTIRHLADEPCSGAGLSASGAAAALRGREECPHPLRN